MPNQTMNSFYEQAAITALTSAREEFERAQASLSGACMSCFITWQAQEAAIQGEKIKVDIAAVKIEFLEHVLGIAAPKRKTANASKHA